MRDRNCIKLKFECRWVNYSSFRLINKALSWTCCGERCWKFNIPIGSIALHFSSLERTASDSTRDPSPMPSRIQQTYRFDMNLCSLFFNFLDRADFLERAWRFNAFNARARAHTAFAKHDIAEIASRRTDEIAVIEIHARASRGILWSVCFRALRVRSDF